MPSLTGLAAKCDRELARLGATPGHDASMSESDAVRIGHPVAGRMAERQPEGARSADAARLRGTARDRGSLPVARIAGHTLQSTALVHEAYFKLIGQRRVQWQNRAHFFGIAAQMMRRILVDHARHQHRDKRGGGVPKLSLDEAIAVAEPKPMSICSRWTRR